MKLQKTTWLLSFLALFFGLLVYYYEVPFQAQRQSLKQQQEKLFTFAEGDIQSIIIEKSGEVLEFVRNQDEARPWQMKKPLQVNASSAAISFLTDLLVNGKKERSLNISSEQLAAYGLRQPFATIKLKLNTGKIHQLILGKNNFNQQLIYGQITPEQNNSQNIEILLLPKNFQYAVERDLKEWQDISTE